MASPYDHLNRAALIERLTALEASQQATLPVPQALQLLNLLPLGIVILDQQTRIHYVNNSVCTLFGRSQAEMLGQILKDMVWQIVHDDGRPYIDAELPLHLAITRQQAIRDVVVGWHDPQQANPIWTLLSVFPHTNTMGSVEYLVMTLADLSNRKQAEERQQVLTSATSLLASSLNVEDTLQAIASMAVPALADWCSVLLFESPGVVRRVAASSAYPDTTNALDRLQQRIVLARLGADTNSPLTTGITEIIPIVDQQQLERLASNAEHLEALRELGTTSVMRTPLVARGQIIGMLGAAYGRSGRQYSTADQPLFEELAHAAALAIENAQLYHTAQQHLIELNIIQRTVHLISTSVPLDTIFHDTVSTISTAFGYQHISIYLVDGDRLHLQAALGYDHVISEIGLDEGVSGRVARTGEAAFVRESQEDADFLHAMPSINQCIIVPLSDQHGHVIGTLAVESVNANLTDNDLRILTLVANQINIAIANARLFSALRDSEQRYQAVIDQAADAILLTDSDWRLTDMNREALRLFAQPREQLLGHSVAELCTLEQPDHWPPAPGAVFGITQPNAELVRVEASIGTLVHDDRTQQVVIMRNVTERLRIEELQRTAERQLIEAQNVERLGVMAGGIAHDFNNLLMTIAGNVGLIADKLPDNSPYQEQLIEINEAAQRAATLTQQLLTYAGKSRMHLRPLTIRFLFEELQILVRSIINPAIRVEWVIDNQVPVIQADSTQIRQVLLNLITNASEALGNTAGTITIQASNHWSTTDSARLQHLQLSVRDTGPGIDPALHQRIFEPFFTSKFTGRGLGLAVVQGIVRAHGGTLAVASQPGSGTLFTVLLPAAPELQPAPAMRPVLPNSKQAPAQEILLVDDESSVRQTISSMLELLGHRVVTADGGHAALQLARERNTSLALVLLDMTMPDLSGVEVFTHLRQIAPRLPIILITGYSADDIGQRFGGTVPELVLHKPFSISALRSAVARAFAPDRVGV